MPVQAPRILGSLAVLTLVVSAFACSDNITIAAAPGADGGAACGNGILEANEECESFDTRGATCDSLGLDVGVVKCGADCKLDTTGCGGKCGDGQVTGAEQCDGTNLNGKSCASLLGSSTVAGSLSCSSDCHFITDACSEPTATNALSACDPAKGDSCAAPSKCLATAKGNFCLEACDLTASACGEGRYCEDIGGKGACADVPKAGQGCSARSGCSTTGQTCVPTFLDATGAAVSTCAKSCPASEIGTGQASCGAGSSCTAVGGGPVELQSQAACTTSAECQQTQGYTCNSVTTAAGEVLRCTRPYGQCAPVTPLYRFDGSTVNDAQLCDRTAPTRGAAKCGLSSSTPIVNPARVDCVEHFSGTPQIGVCTAFCEGGMNAAGATIELACGDGARCAVPTTPEFFVGQGDATPVACSNVAGASACGAGFDKCVDLGRGQECARAVKICVPN